MIAELFDLITPVFQPAREVSRFDVAPIPLEGPSTLQLAIIAIVTLAAYALLRRWRRQPVAASSAQGAKGKERPREAA